MTSQVRTAHEPGLNQPACRCAIAAPMSILAACDLHLTPASGPLPDLSRKPSRTPPKELLERMQQQNRMSQGITDSQ